MENKAIQELEQKFFKTFGIEPTEEKYCYHECKLPELKDKPCEAICPHQRHYIRYPQITDTIVLKLICVISNFDQYYRCFYTKYEQIKPCVLYELLKIFEALTISPWVKPYMCIPGGAGKLTCDIRKIFEEE